MPLQCFWKDFSTLCFETEETVTITVSFVLDINMTAFLMSYTLFTDKCSQAALMNPRAVEGNNEIEEWRIPSLNEGIYGLIAKTRCISEEKKIQCWMEKEDKYQIIHYQMT